MKRLILLVFCLALSCGAIAQILTIDAADSVRRIVDIPPRPDYDISEYLKTNLKYPIEARDNRIEGRVTIQFIVNKDGSISDVKVMGNKRLYAGCEEEATRIISVMPKWKPAKVSGQPVKAYYTQYVTFRLEDDKH